MTSPATWDLAVVGGGTVGLACAFALAQRGWSVTVLERDTPGAHASRIAAGLLGTASFPLGEQDAIFPLRLDSLRRYPQFVAEIEAAGGVDAGYQTEGTPWLARDAAELAQLEALQADRAEKGLQSELVTAAEAAALEPNVQAALVGGLRVDDDVQIDPRRLLQSLLAALEAVDVEVRSGCDVVGARQEGDGWSLTLRDQPAVRARQLLLTAGPWSDQILNLDQERASAPLAPAQIGPVKGQLLRLQAPPLLSRVVHTLDTLLAQRRHGEVIAAATIEPDAGWDLTPTAEAREDLLARAAAVLPQVREAELVEHSVGLRPAAPDRLPVLGAAGPNLWIAAGHFRHGILLAPATAHYLAEALTSGETPAALTDYSLARMEESE